MSSYLKDAFGDVATHNKAMRVEFNNEGLQQGEAFEIPGINAKVDQELTQTLAADLLKTPGINN